MSWSVASSCALIWHPCSHSRCTVHVISCGGLSSSGALAPRGAKRGTKRSAGYSIDVEIGLPLPAKVTPSRYVAACAAGDVSALCAAMAKPYGPLALSCLDLRAAWHRAAPRRRMRGSCCGGREGSLRAHVAIYRPSSSLIGEHPHDLPPGRMWRRTFRSGVALRRRRVRARRLVSPHILTSRPSAVLLSPIPIAAGCVLSGARAALEWRVRGASERRVIHHNRCVFATFPDSMRCTSLTGATVATLSQMTRVTNTSLNM